MRLRVLGTVELIVDETGAMGFAGVGVPLNSPKLRRLLAALLVRPNAVVSVDRLADILWRDAAPVHIAGSLQQVISRLRGALRACGADADAAGAVALLTRSPGYLLRVPRGALDATNFEDLLSCARTSARTDPATSAALLDEALALWRGPAYAEFADADFAHVEALRLEELRLVATEERAQAALMLGRPDEAINRLETVVAEQPLRERAVAQLMLAFYRTGRQAAALSSFHEHRARLREELGVEPSPSLGRLHADILRQNPLLHAPTVPPSGGTADAPSRQSPSYLPDMIFQPAAGEAASVPGNLPLAGRTRLVGQDELLAQVEAELGDVRLVTLTGPGGVGKSSVALHVALATRSTRCGGGFADGVWVCELAAVDDGAAVAHAVSTALGVQQRHGLPLMQRLVEYLRPKRLLLMLDNCEHVVDAVARLVDAVIRGCPHVVVLATSREPLRLAGEQVRPVLPLAVPAPTVAGAAHVGRAPAVTLFVERAAAATGAFTLTDHNAGAVAELCRQLDGLPLAIELAATRMRSMTPAEAVERLSARFRFLRGGDRTAAERHRTLRSVVDWSYTALEDHEQRVFDRLSVFAGSFGLSAAERVAADALRVDGGLDEVAIADALGNLVEKSMVLAVAETRSRYSLLETLRAYGRDRLAKRGETDAVCRAHAEYHAGLAQELGRLSGPDLATTAEAITDCLDDLRAAHRWALAHDPALALRLVGALADYAETRMVPEITLWAEQAIEAANVSGAESGVLAEAYAVAAGGARFRGDLRRAADLARRGLAAAAGRPRHACLPLYLLGEIAVLDGRLDDGEHFSMQAEKAAQAAGDHLRLALAGANRVLARAYGGDTDSAIALAAQVRQRAERSGNPFAAAWARYAAGEVRLETDPDLAVTLLDQARALGEALGERYLAGVALVSAASVRARHGDPREALPLFDDVVKHWHASGDWTHQWTTLRNIVDLLVRVGADESAAVLHAALASRATAPRVFGADAQRLAQTRRVLSERLGPHAWATAVTRGRGLTDDEVVRCARAAIAAAAQPINQSSSG